MLTAAAMDCCVLANNHVLDWGLDGLLDTLNSLERLHIKTAGHPDMAAASAGASLMPSPTITLESALLGCDSVDFVGRLTVGKHRSKHN